MVSKTSNSEIKVYRDRYVALLANKSCDAVNLDYLCTICFYLSIYLKCMTAMSVAHTKSYTASNDRRIGEKCIEKDAEGIDRALILDIPPVST